MSGLLHSTNYDLEQTKRDVYASHASQARTNSSVGLADGQRREGVGVGVDTNAGHRKSRYV
jgi:hypothetical protein